MASKHSSSQWFASIFLTAALASSPLTMSGSTSAQGQLEAPIRADAPQGYGEWSVFRVTLALRSANDYARASKVVSRWLGELPKADAGYPLQMRALVTGAEQERLTRMSIRPALADELNALLEGHAKDAGDTVKALKLMVAQLNASASERVSERLSAADAEARLRSVLVGLSVAQANGLNALTSLDDDGDGLTNTQETWWCTNPLNANSDGDGPWDSVEVQQAKDWIGNRRAGYSADGKPFAGWPMKPGDGNFNPSCQDSDFDGVPDNAETWELGLNRNLESTDRDKFDDGQELFGITPPNWGLLPRTEDVLFIGTDMPTWVLAPGNHPMVAGFPKPEVVVVPSSFVVKAVTTIQTERTVSENEEYSYTTARTDGTSTSVGNTETWNEWQEVSQTTQRSPSPGILRASQNADLGLLKLGGATFGVLGAIGGVACTIATGGLCLPLAIAGLAGATAALTGEALDQLDKVQAEAKANSCAPDAPYLVPKCLKSASSTEPLKPGPMCVHEAASTQNMCRASAGTNYEIAPQPGQLKSVQAQTVYQVHYPEPRFVPTRTDTKGSSRGHSVTTTSEQYEEHTVTNGQAFGTMNGWSNSTAQQSSHAADFWFAYKVRNGGMDYLLNLCNLAFNVFIGDDPNPANTYFVSPDLGGDGCFHNYSPGQERIFSARTQSHAIPLSLDEMKAIDLGLPVRVVLADYSFGTDQLFYESARTAGVLVDIEDGTDDGDETVDTYLVPTWGDGDTMQDVIGRYFPSEQDNDGNDIAIWTPETTGGTIPAYCMEGRHYGLAPQVWCKHALSTSDWWNIYLNNLGDGTTELNQTFAAPNSTAFFRFNRDTDVDGYSDRTEDRLGTAPNDPASHPKPELLAGVSKRPVANGIVTATASLLNMGLYDAYGVELIMIAPDDSITILNNTVGGSGRVKATKSVVVGSKTALSPLQAAWTQTGHAKPSSGGYYTGNADRVYIFAASCANPGGCDVGGISSTLTLNWNDGAGVTGTLALGGGYASPTPLNVGGLGVQLSMLSGKIYNNETFSVTANTPRDTFSYRINREPHTEPLVIVSYNDPEGNHRFIIPSAAMSLTAPTQSLAPFAGQMLQDPGVEIATTAAFTPTAAQSVTVVVNNPTGVSLVNAHLFLEFVNISGTVAAEFPMTASLPPGPSSLSMNWNTDAFLPTFQAGEDYIAMVFLTDYQGNILDTGGRPLSSWQADPKADFAMASADTDWDFGSAAQGTLMKRNFTFANVGLQDMLTYIQGVPGLSLSQTGSRRVSAADQTTYEIALNTIGLPVGVYDQSIVIRSSDPARPTQTVRVHGTVSPAAGNTQSGQLVRPLDIDVVVNTGIQGEWVTYTHALGPTPQTLHPVKVYTDYAAPLIGVGRYATDFSVGTASAEMFGNGRDGVMPGSGNLDYAQGAAFGIVNSGNAGSTSISVSDAWGIARIKSGDVIMIHQTQGVGGGNWELNKAAADFTGSGTFSLQKPMSNNYSTSGNNRAQILRVPQYTWCNVTGAATPLKAWDGSTGGIYAIMCSETAAIGGSISANGSNGAVINDNPWDTGITIGGGFRGGYGRGGERDPNRAQAGEGVTGVGTESIAANGIGGGGAEAGGPYIGSGGGGGNGSNGAAGQQCCVSNNFAGSGGLITANADLTLMSFGGGGGGGAAVRVGTNGAGGSGGGIVVLFGKNVQLTGVVKSNGGRGGGAGNGDSATGGGGAGGSVLIKGQTVNLGDSLVQATGGQAWNRGGSGGNGRIRVEYCTDRSGTSIPPASVQKLLCHIAEQVESAPFTLGRLNLPSNISIPTTFRAQYGRLMTFTVSGNASTALRVPAGLVSTATIQSLVSGLSGPTSFSLDIGDDGSMDWTGVLANNSENTSPDLASAFNAYWATHGSPVTGTLDVPVRVALGGAGQVQLTNLQMRLATSAAPASNDPPLDVTVTFTGGYSAGTWLTYTHSLGPDPISLHPVKVYSATYGPLLGAGRYATDFAPGTASGDLFGNGTDGDLIVASGSSIESNSTRTSIAASGSTVVVASTAGFSPGDTVLFHQSQDETSAGRWELGEILSIDSANTWTLKKPLANTYSSVFGTTCGSGWWGEYFGNTTLSGTPVYSRCDGDIDYEWDTGTPGGGMPGADFSIRWTGQYFFPGGVFQFANYGNDGMRVRLDGATIIDYWSTGWPGQGCPNCAPPASVGVSRGFHTVVVEFVNLGRGGGIRFDIQRVQRAQAIRVPRYRDVVVASGATLYAPAWNGWAGGILYFLANGTVMINGVVSANGSSGSNVSGTCVPRGGAAVGAGFRGGDGFRAHTETSECYWVRTDQGGWQGEGTRGYAYHIEQSNANAGGGGDNGGDFGKGSGGGGGNGTPGGNGFGGTAQGGGSSGSIDLSLMTFGGGRGGAGKPYPAQVGGGGAGAGIVGIVARYLTVNGAIQTNGGAGGSSGAYDMAGGGGAGGSILIRSALPVLGLNTVNATGGPGGIAGDGNGGGGGMGRIRVEYCETPPTYQTNPAAGTTQKLTCHIAEQVEASPFGQGRLSLSESLNGTRTYKIQYGRKLTFIAAGNQLTQLRVPAGLFSNVILQSLLSGLSANTTFSIDIGDDGSIEWSGTYGNISTNNSPDLSAAFNAWWATHGAPKSGTLDVPIRVSLGGPGQVLLTNLQTQLSGNPLRFVRLPARNYSNVAINYTIGGTGTGPLTLAADVGDDGTIDWTTTGTVAFPFTANTANLMTATNAYLTGKSGEVDVPIRFYVSPSTAALTLNSFVATPSQLPDASISLADLSVSDPTPTESDTISLTGVLRNSTARDTGGLVASAFAILSGTTPGAYYIGSAFVPNIPASGTATTEIAWNTLGITGNVPVRIVLDPFNRVTETLENNNVATATVSIRSRADLRVRSTSLPPADLTVGKPATFNVVIGNDGQTAAPANTLGLFRGNADAGIPPAELLDLAGVPGSGALTVTVIYTPASPGPLRLSLRANLSRTVNEFDLSNNDLWLDRYVGVGGERMLDSGNPPNDPTYTSTLGYGVVDEGQPDETNLACAGSPSGPEDSFRRDPSGKIVVRFDHLKRGSNYHLDVVLNGCAIAGRQEIVKVNGVAVTGLIDIGLSKQRISQLLDPALYADRQISVTIETTSTRGAVVSVIALREIEYRYIDAGGGADPAYSAQSGQGWLDTPTAVSAICGPLPYQTLRIDQNDNELRYRFDGLNPTKKYVLKTTYHQCEGINLQQAIQIDMRVTGADVFIPSGTLVADEREVPLTTYANDGSIDVSIIRQSDTSGALVSEIALEEKTLEAPQACVPMRNTTADNFAMVYGGVFVGGMEVPAGTLVTAEDPRGNVIGCFQVSAAGLYGTMALLGEDTSVVPNLAGLRAGEPPLFRIGGALAVPQRAYSFTADADIHPVTLTTDGIGAQQVLMEPGWNFVSTRNQHPVGLVETVLRPISGKYCRVRGETQLFACNLAEGFRTLKQLNAGVGYYIYITNTVTVNGLFEGVTQPPDKPISMHAGLNWTGYLPPVSLPITYALQSIAGHYVRVVDINADPVVAYMPALPQFSFLATLRPGNAYLIYTTDAVTLTYPATAPAMAQTESKEAEALKTQTQATCGPAQKTPDFTLLYGYARVNGGWAAPGAKIEAVTPEGLVVGCALVREDGMFGLLAAFGADPATATPGALKNQMLRFRIDGVLDEATTLAWENDHDTHVMYPGVSVMRAFLPGLSR